MKNKLDKYIMMSLRTSLGAKQSESSLGRLIVAATFECFCIFLKVVISTIGRNLFLTKLSDFSVEDSFEMTFPKYSKGLEGLGYSTLLSMSLN
jgi:hypothetical protein